MPTDHLPELFGPADAAPVRNMPEHGNRPALLLRRLLRAKDHMDAFSCQAWPISRLAAVSGVSEAHFARSFRQAFGLPPHRYLLTRRIERAAALLRDTDLAVTAIAFETGTALARSDARFATSPARVRMPAGRASAHRRRDPITFPPVISVPPAALH